MDDDNDGVAALRIPRYLSEVAGRADCADLREWVAALPEVVADLAARWELRVGQPYEPGGQCSWVAPARTLAGADLVLKVGWRHPEAEQEADALRLWCGDGAVRLYAAETVDQTSALLVERCTPGTPLGQSTAEPEQDIIIADLLGRLWTQPLAGHPFRPLQGMCDDWTAEFEQQATQLVTHSGAGLDPGLIRAGMILFRELPRSAPDVVLLCTDLHGENVLAARRAPWLVIDPKPYVGDRTYDVLQHMLNCEQRLVTDPMGFAQRIAALLDLDAGRLRLWLFARCVQQCLDQPVLYQVATQLRP